MGQVTRYLGYSSLKDFFPSMEIKPNPGCSNPLCIQRQASYQASFNSPAAVAERAAAQQAAEAAAAQEAAVLHEDNEWGIEVADEAGPGPSGGEPGAAQQQHDQRQEQLAEGLEYSFPVRNDIVLSEHHQYVQLHFLKMPFPAVFYRLTKCFTCVMYRRPAAMGLLKPLLEHKHLLRMLMTSCLNYKL